MANQGTDRQTNHSATRRVAKAPLPASLLQAVAAGDENLWLWCIRNLAAVRVALILEGIKSAAIARGVEHVVRKLADLERQTGQTHFVIGDTEMGGLLGVHRTTADVWINAAVEFEIVARTGEGQGREQELSLIRRPILLRVRAAAAGNEIGHAGLFEFPDAPEPVAPADKFSPDPTQLVAPPDKSDGESEGGVGGDARAQLTSSVLKEEKQEIDSFSMEARGKSGDAQPPQRLLLFDLAAGLDAANQDIAATQILIDGETIARKSGDAALSGKIDAVSADVMALRHEVRSQGGLQPSRMRTSEAEQLIARLMDCDVALAGEAYDRARARGKADSWIEAVISECERNSVIDETPEGRRRTCKWDGGAIYRHVAEKGDVASLAALPASNKFRAACGRLESRTRQAAREQELAGAAGIAAAVVPEIWRRFAPKIDRMTRGQRLELAQAELEETDVQYLRAYEPTPEIKMRLCVALQRRSANGGLAAQ